MRPGIWNSRLLVLQHESGETLQELGPLLVRRGARVRSVDFSRHPGARPRLDGHDGLIVLGGPLNVRDARRVPHLPWEMALIRQAVKSDTPVLGICLGAQLIAKALGGTVSRARAPEIGWHELNLTPAGRCDPLFAGFASGQKVFQWHEYAFTLPHGAVRLASSLLCREQAFRFGKNAYALQFHPEIDASPLAGGIAACFSVLCAERRAPVSGLCGARAAGKTRPQSESRARRP